MAPARGHERKARPHGSPKPSGASDFHSVFAEVYGARWGRLQHSLSQPTEHVALQNAFASGAEFSNNTWQPSAVYGPIKTYRYVETTGSYMQPRPDSQSRLLSWYWLDEASLLPVLLLDPRPGCTVLDMCAAPGGKSLMLASMLFAQQTHPQSTAADWQDMSSAKLIAQLDTAGIQEAGRVTGRQDSRSPQSQAQDQEATPLQQNVPDSTERNSHSPQVSHGPDNSAASHTEQAQSHTQQSVSDQLAGMRVSADNEESVTQSKSSSNSNIPASLAAQHGQNAAASGSLTCNELDPSRRSRLHNVMNLYLPQPLMRKVRVTPHDSARYWGRFEAETYDCILLDAPCTSERHVIQQASNDSGKGSKLRWSLRQCEDLAALQVRLLVAALKAVKPGGRVVYSTCSISPLENDQVVSKALSGLQETQMQISISTKVHEMLQQSAAPCAEASKVLTPLTELLMQLKAEPTEHGMIVMPDKAGSGPMYVCLLLKS